MPDPTPAGCPESMTLSGYKGSPEFSTFTTNVKRIQLEFYTDNGAERSQFKSEGYRKMEIWAHVVLAMTNVKLNTRIT